MRNLPITTYYLQVTSPGQIRLKRSPDSSVKIDRADNPAPGFAQWLYRTVGRDWYWVDRYNWTLDQWRKRFADPAVSMWVMDSSGDPAGYYELDEQHNGDMEFSSFGLLPGAIGRGLGGHILPASGSILLGQRESAVTGKIAIACGCHLPQPEVQIAPHAVTAIPFEDEGLCPWKFGARAESPTDELLKVSCIPAWPQHHFTDGQHLGHRFILLRLNCSPLECRCYVEAVRHGNSGSALPLT